MSRPSIFISYHHKDENWKDRLVTHLGVLQSQGLLDLWDDRSIGAGESWFTEIENALNKADVAVLLISANYLTSNFINKEELPSLFKRQHEEGLVILPVLVSPCAWHHVNWLRSIQMRPKDGIPLASMTEYDKDKSLATISEEVATILDIASSKKITKVAKPEPEEKIIDKKIQKVDFFISHSHKDGDFAELLKLRIEKEGYSAWIDIERLRVGEDWRQEIDQAINDTSALIVVITPEAKESEYVTYEWAFAWGVGVKVIPIMLKQAQFHPRLETLQHLDFTNRAARPWNLLIEALKDAHKTKTKGN